MLPRKMRSRGMMRGLVKIPRREKMTVCIGAICDKGKTVVVCADRMMTYGPPMNLQAEGAVRKIFPLTDQCVLLFSGSVPDGEYVINNSQARIKAVQPPPDIKTVASLVNAVYQEHKKKRAEDSILRPFLGIDFAGFQALVAQSASSQVLTQLLGMISQHNLGLDLMIAGVDKDGAHLLLVSHPGNVMSLDTVGTASIGSGGLHGAIRMSLSKPTQDGTLAQAMHNLYEAKLASEVAPGVGKATDIAVINGTGHKFVDASTLKVLQEIHKDRPELDDTDLKKLTTKCEEYAK
jgi:20S proteasome alpha/beta subunit